MVVEIRRANGLLFSVDTADFKEIGEHETGGTYILFSDGTSILLDQDYETVMNFFKSCPACSDSDFVAPAFTLMSKQQFKKLKMRVKRVKRVKGQNCV